MKTKFTKLFSAHQQYKYVKCELLKAPESDWEKDADGDNQLVKFEQRRETN